MKKKLIRITFMLAALALLTAGCAEQYAGNSRLRNLYRVLNYPTSFKERTLCFEMEDYGELVGNGEFYIMGAGISTPAAYPCSESETLLSAIEKAGQTASFSGISYTLIKGIRDDEREIRGLALLSGSAMSPEVEPGDLICLTSMPASVALSQ